MDLPDTLDQLLSLGAVMLACEDRHYCETGEEKMVFIDHPLNDMTEPGVDPFIAYGVFRCSICGDWWGNWIFRDVSHDGSDWYRFGSMAPTRRHREIPEEL